MRDANGAPMNQNNQEVQEDVLLKITIENALQAAKTMPYNEFVAMA